MLTLDADGERKDVEFDEVQGILDELKPALSDNIGADPTALMAHLNAYYKEVEAGGEEAILEKALKQIDDPDLRQRMYVMLMRVAISDRQLHKQEDTLLRRIGSAWGMTYKGT